MEVTFYWENHNEQVFRNTDYYEGFEEDMGLWKVEASESVLRKSLFRKVTFVSYDLMDENNPTWHKSRGKPR